MKEMLASIIAVALWKLLISSVVLCAFAVLAIVVIFTVLVGGIIVLALLPILLVLKILCWCVRVLERFATKAPLFPVMAFR